MYPITIIKCNLLTLALAIILLLHLLLATQTFRHRAKVTQNNLRVKDRERVIALKLSLTCVLTLLLLLHLLLATQTFRYREPNQTTRVS